VCLQLFFVLYFVHVQYPILLHLSLVVRIDRPITCDEKSPLETSAFIEIWVPTFKISFPKKISQKASSTVPMTPRKQIVTLNGATSKGKAIGTIGGTAPPPAFDQPCTTEDTDSSSP